MRSGYVRIPASGHLPAAQSPTGQPLRGQPGYLVSDGGGGGAAPPLEALQAAYYRIGGPDVRTAAYAVGPLAAEIAGFDTSRASLEIYCDDSSPNPIYIGGPEVAAVTGGNQPNAGVRINPGNGRIYDGADRAKRIYAICASGGTATVVVVSTPTVPEA